MNEYKQIHEVFIDSKSNEHIDFNDLYIKLAVYYIYYILIYENLIKEYSYIIYTSNIKCNENIFVWIPIFFAFSIISIKVSFVKVPHVSDKQILSIFNVLNVNNSDIMVNNGIFPSIGHSSIQETYTLILASFFILIFSVIFLICINDSFKLILVFFI